MAKRDAAPGTENAEAAAEAGIEAANATEAALAEEIATDLASAFDQAEEAEAAEGAEPDTETNDDPPADAGDEASDPPATPAENEEEEAAAEEAEAAASGEDDAGEEEAAAEEQEQEAAEGEEAEAGDLEPIEAPVSWSDEDKEVFAGLERNAQEVIARREAERDAGLTEARQADEADLRFAKEIHETMKPFEQDLKLAAHTEKQFIESLLAAHQMLSNEPATALPWIIENYGIDLTPILKTYIAEGKVNVEDLGITGDLDNLGLSEDDDLEDLSPREKQMLERINAQDAKLAELEKGQTDAATSAQQQETNEVLRLYNAFITETGEDGKSTHPHLEEVRTTMDALLRSGEAERAVAAEKNVSVEQISDSDIPNVLTKAYDMAVAARGLASPAPPAPPANTGNGRANAGDDADAQKKARAAEAARVKAAKDAKKAGVGVKSASTGQAASTADGGYQSLEEELSARIDAAQEG